MFVKNSAALDNPTILIGYVDDVVHLVAADTLSEALEIICQEGLRSLEWGTKFGAVFDRKKAVPMILSSKQLNPPPFNLGGIGLTFLKSTSWIGIILDQRITFSEQVKRAKTIGNLLVMQLNRIVKLSYGLNPGLTKQLVIAVIYVRVLFGSLVWYNSRNSKMVEGVLDRIWHQAGRLVTGLFRKTLLVFVRKVCGRLNSLTSIKMRNTHSFVKALTYHPSPNSPHPMPRAN